MEAPKQDLKGGYMYNILIVEDNPIDAKILTYFLNKRGYISYVASNAYQAIEYLQKYSVDLILLDWMLPNVSGIDLLRTIRANSKAMQMPVIIISGRNEMKDVEKAIKTGASDYIIKPMDDDILSGKLQRLLNREIEWRPINIEKVDDGKGSVSSPIRVIRISEIGIEIESELSIEVGSLIELRLPIFFDLDLPVILTKIFQKNAVGTVYHLQCSIVGLKESDLKKIRLKIRSLQKNEMKITT